MLLSILLLDEGHVYLFHLFLRVKHKFEKAGGVRGTLSDNTAWLPPCLIIREGNAKDRCP